MEERRKRKYPYQETPQCSCQEPREGGDENSYGPEHCEKCSKRLKGNDVEESFSHPDEAAAGSSDGKKSKSSSNTVTPAPPVFNRNLLAPGAPRVLVENHQLNAEPAADLLNLDTFNSQQYYLRTPPSIKNQKLYFKGYSSQNEYRGFDRFDRVSDEIILKIIHYLPRHTLCTCALVCRRWARIICDMSLWKRMDMGGRLVKKGVLKIILERGVEFLRLNRSEIMGDFNCTVVGSPDPRRSPLSEDRLYRLQYLDMSMANVKTSLVESMLRFCPNLQKISLENIPVTEQLLINLSLNSPYLDTLNLCMSAGVTAEGLCCIFQNCTNLLELNIAWTGLSYTDMMVVSQNLPSQLLALNISGGRERMSDNAIAALSLRCTQLQDLDISDSTIITNRTIESITKNLQRLRMLSISRCYKISASHIVTLRDLPKMERINMFGIVRQATLDMLEQHLSQLKVNRYPFSAIARPTVNNSKFARIWNQRPR